MPFPKISCVPSTRRHCKKTWKDCGSLVNVFFCSPWNSFKNHMFHYTETLACNCRNCIFTKADSAGSVALWRWQVALIPVQFVASHCTSFLLGNWEYVWAFLIHDFALVGLPSADWVYTVVRIVKRKKRLRLCLLMAAQSLEVKQPCVSAISSDFYKTGASPNDPASLSWTHGLSYVASSPTVLKPPSLPRWCSHWNMISTNSLGKSQDFNPG